MKNIKLMALLSFLCLLILIPSVCAMDNQTTIDAGSDADVLGDEYYFDSNIENDTGNGTLDNPYRDLTASRIKDNSVIHLSSGQYSVNQKLNLGSVTIIGQNPENTILTTNGNGISVSKTLTLVNVTILNSNIANSGTLHATNTIFDSSSGYKADSYGTYGGAIYANSNSHVILDNATFINNWAKYGGAIYMKDATLEIYDSLFMNNYALLYGGAIAGEGSLDEDDDGNEIIKRADIIMVNTQFLYDYSLGDAGGALYLKYSTFEAYKLNATGCNATFGGAITLLKSDADISFAYGFNNTAKYDGGFIYHMYDSLTVLNSNISNNVANNGAGLFVDQSDDCIVANNTFSFNHANICAGAIYQLYYAYFDINNTYYNNSAMVCDDLYQTYDVNMNIGNSNYTLYFYDSTDVGQLPSKYDLRDLNQVTPIKNQGNGGNCWAFACIGALESCIIKASGDRFDFSEENMKNLFGRFSDFGWTLDTNDGGYPNMAYNYLISWLGPVLESEDPYSAKTTLSPVLNSIMHVQNVVFLKRNNYTDNDAIKKAIMAYGGVHTPIYVTGNYNQYYTGDKANHAVVIVGWDDTKIISGAPGPGAWIIRNSWGSSLSYFYVSYYDTSCAPLGNTRKVYTFILNDTIKYDKNYQYDVQGLTDFFLNSSSTVCYKNVFDATDDEYLAAVSTFFEKDTNWQFSVYVNDQLKTTQSGFSHAGYYTFNLNEIIPLNEGDVFEVIFNITVDGDVGVPISEACSFQKDLFYTNISFISYDGINWMDLYDVEWTYPDHSYYGQQIACIKAFTILNPIKTSIELSFENISSDKADLIATVYNEWGHPVGNGVVTFNVCGTYHEVNIDNGIARLGNVSISDGINNFSATFAATGYDSSFNHVLISIEKVKTTLDLTFSGSKNPVEINATVRDINGNPALCGEVIFEIDGVNYTVDINNGVASLVHVFKTGCLNNISAYYNDLYCYHFSNSSDSLVVDLENANMSLIFSGEYNPVNITAIITDEFGNGVNYGTVNFNVEGSVYPISVVNGRASLNHVFEHIGLNEVIVEYNGLYYYTSSRNVSSINVKLIKTTLNLNIEPKTYNSVEIIASVFDEDNNLVNVGNVIFTIEGEEYPIVLDNGIARTNYTFKNTGINNVSARYESNCYYDASNNSSQYNVPKIDVILDLTIEKHLDTVTITVQCPDLENEYVYVLVDETLMSSKIQNSKATFTLTSLSTGEHSVKAYIISEKYDAQNVTGSFTVYNYNTLITAECDAYYGKNNCTVTLKNTDGTLLKDKRITITVGTKTYDRYTNGSGIAVIPIDLDYSVSQIKIAFAGDDDYNSTGLDMPIAVKSTIAADNAKKTYNSKYNVIVTDSNGNPLNGAEVDFIINNKVYKAYSNNGVASLNIYLNPGVYNVDIVNNVTGESKTRQITVVKRITDNKDLTMYYGAGKSYTVRVYDDNGNVLRNARVTFKINGKTYYANSNSNGYASLKIGLAPKTYTITAEYNGYKVSNKVTVKTTIITKNAAVKKGKVLKFTAKILNSKGKIIKYKYVTFKFKGKTYKIKTNAYGVSALKVKVNYKAGRYSIATTYSKLTVKNIITLRQ